MTRPSDLAPQIGSNRDQVQFNDDGSATITFFGIKNDSNRQGSEARVEPADRYEVDPVNCLKIYIARTAHCITTAPGPVFLSLNRPYKAINFGSVAQILRDSIADAGLSQSFTARCFRPSAATDTIVSGCDPQTTRQIGRWKTEAVFYERYVYPISQHNTAQTILSSDVKINKSN